MSEREFAKKDVKGRNVKAKYGYGSRILECKNERSFKATMLQRNMNFGGDITP